MSSPKTVAVKKGASEAQVRANRANCLKSTGPKSVEGKAKSSQNAISHGFFSRKVVLEGENAQEFEQLRQAMLAEHQPKTVTEQFLVERMAISMWRLNRAQEIERHAYEDMADSVRNKVSEARAPRECSNPSLALWILSGTKHSVLEKLEMYEKRLEGTLHRSSRELRKMREATETKSDETKPIWEEEKVTQEVVEEGVGAVSISIEDCSADDTEPSPRPSPGVPGEGEEARNAPPFSGAPAGPPLTIEEVG